MRGVAALVVPVWRTLPWRTLGAAGVVAVSPLALVRVLGSGPGPVQALWMLRAAGLALALGLGFLLDDPARHVTAAVPVRRAVRTVLRIGLVVPVAGAWWAGVLLLVPGADRPPAGDVTLEAGTGCVLALAGAAVAVRRSAEPEPGWGVAGVLLCAAVLAPLSLPARWALFATPADPRWVQGHERWVWVLAGAAAVWVVASREPVGRGR